MHSQMEWSQSSQGLPQATPTEQQHSDFNANLGRLYSHRPSIILVQQEPLLLSGRNLSMKIYEKILRKKGKNVAVRSPNSIFSRLCNSSFDCSYPCKCGLCGRGCIRVNTRTRRIPEYLYRFRSSTHPVQAPRTRRYPRTCGSAC